MVRYVLPTESTYLDAVAIPRAIGSSNRSLSSITCTKFAPTKPVTTTTAAVRDELAPITAWEGRTQMKRYIWKLSQLIDN